MMGRSSNQRILPILEGGAFINLAKRLYSHPWNMYFKNVEKPGVNIIISFFFNPLKIMELPSWIWPETYKYKKDVKPRLPCHRSTLRFSNL